MAKDNFLLHTEYKEQIELLNMEQRGVLLTALMCYQSQDELPQMDDTTKMCFSFIKARIDKENVAYEEKCRKNAENGALGGRPRKAVTFEENRTVSEKSERFLEIPKKADIDTDIDIDNLKEKESPKGDSKKKTMQGIIDNKRFVPPTVDDVREYAAEKGYANFEAEQFVDFYASKGWMVGKNKMKDWKASVRGWHSRNKTKDTKVNFTQRSDNLNDIARQLIRGSSP